MNKFLNLLNNYLKWTFGIKPRTVKELKRFILIFGIILLGIILAFIIGDSIVQKSIDKNGIISLAIFIPLSILNIFSFSILSKSQITDLKTISGGNFANFLLNAGTLSSRIALFVFLLNVSLVIFIILGGAIGIVLILLILLSWVISGGSLIIDEIVTKIWDIATIPVKIYYFEFELLEKIPPLVQHYFIIFFVLFFVAVASILSIFVIAKRKEF